MRRRNLWRAVFSRILELRRRLPERVRDPEYGKQLRSLRHDVRVESILSGDDDLHDLLTRDLGARRSRVGHRNDSR